MSDLKQEVKMLEALERAIENVANKGLIGDVESLSMSYLKISAALKLQMRDANE